MFVFLMNFVKNWTSNAYKEKFPIDIRYFSNAKIKTYEEPSIKLSSILSTGPKHRWFFFQKNGNF